jgi:hypothetical protein
MRLASPARTWFHRRNDIRAPLPLSLPPAPCPLLLPLLLLPHLTLTRQRTPRDG